MKTKMLRPLLLILLLSASTIVSAQIKVGPIAGLNMSNVTGDSTDNYATKIGFHVGVMVEFNITDNFIINPGVLFTTKGTQDKDSSDYKFNLNYIEIPINAKYKLDNGLNFFAGPYLGINMTSEFVTPDTTLDWKDNTESMDFGLNVGIGFDMEMGLGFSAQYSLGLANINKDYEIAGVKYPAQDNKNSNIAISVRYMFGGK